ncbi:hypothetical protein [Burkholderia stagnalis]|uniref:Glycine zipper family protein n=1 Tax=Burkholderia stagnalis TaxID=1503054 RepID=A0ABX9YXH4_9BURK|nr:hypothetical protein [Burkholderia stagnalis]KVN02593.1 hypothetical protein WT07_13100 [Burkholderia stagnalis]KWE06700.1 hypothetical protein WT48_27870 [Burkholderia stagnalis]KWE11458.1 hypothetical protein WT47_06965 [Burkholderia stagnalis]KWO77988.1 hypothetical protein WU00_09310 [Burkholderia stagnalis]RQQ66501.1 hypothetical protein DF158_01765 [Burkholderia stagnalis]
MAMIVAGRFTTFDDAQGSARCLYDRAFGQDDVSIFFLNPRGQHARFPIGGDEYADAAARPGGRGAMAGALRGLLAGGMVGLGVYALGWRDGLVPAIAALAGACVGVLGGALGGMRERAEEGAGPLESGDGGVMLAAHVTEASAETAEAVLRASGATSIERVDGDWQDGRWCDFDPVRRSGDAPKRPA